MGNHVSCRVPLQFRCVICGAFDPRLHHLMGEASRTVGKREAPPRVGITEWTDGLYWKYGYRPTDGRPTRGHALKSLTYGSYTITPRTFQIRGSGEWTLDFLIAHRGSLRSFSDRATFPTEEQAIQACFAFGRRIIDGNVPHLSVDDIR